jgi:hypothetical protein
MSSLSIPRSCHGSRQDSRLPECPVASNYCGGQVFIRILELIVEVPSELPTIVAPTAPATVIYWAAAIGGGPAEAFNLPRLSYRDLVAMMADRGISVSHTTTHRWVIRYVPEFEKRWNRFARPVNTSWRVDETYIKVRGKWNFLNRAVDKHGKTVDFLLRPDRSIAAAQAFFRKAEFGSLNHFFLWRMAELDL